MNMTLGERNYYRVGGDLSGLLDIWDADCEKRRRKVRAAIRKFKAAGYWGTDEEVAGFTYKSRKGVEVPDGWRWDRGSCATLVPDGRNRKLYTEAKALLANLRKPEPVAFLQMLGISDRFSISVGTRVVIYTNLYELCSIWYFVEGISCPARNHPDLEPIPEWEFIKCLEEHKQRIAGSKSRRGRKAS